MKTPFPYFGGKALVAKEVWRRFGSVDFYIEPFAGSAAVLLNSPSIVHGVLNDLNPFIANFWRAVKNDPEGVAWFADYPKSEIDLRVRHFWLVNMYDYLVQLLRQSHNTYDTEIAGWWVWGASMWIAGGWCDGNGKWAIESGKVVLANKRAGNRGIRLTRPSYNYSGVHRIGDVRLPSRYTLKEAGNVCVQKTVWLLKYMEALSQLLSNTAVLCTDFLEALAFMENKNGNITAVFLDPPYSAERDKRIYDVDSPDVAHMARKWCLENGNNPSFRIALCGYEGEHNELEEYGWNKLAWKAQGGYSHIGNGRGKQNRFLERIWFSPYCHNETIL